MRANPGASVTEIIRINRRPRTRPWRRSSGSRGPGWSSTKAAANGRWPRPRLVMLAQMRQPRREHPGKPGGGWRKSATGRVDGHATPKASPGAGTMRPSPGSQPLDRAPVGRPHGSPCRRRACARRDDDGIAGGLNSAPSFDAHQISRRPRRRPNSLLLRERSSLPGSLAIRPGRLRLTSWSHVPRHARSSP